MFWCAILKTIRPCNRIYFPVLSYSIFTLLYLWHIPDIFELILWQLSAMIMVLVLRWERIRNFCRLLSGNLPIVLAHFLELVCLNTFGPTLNHVEPFSWLGILSYIFACAFVSAALWASSLRYCVGRFVGIEFVLLRRRLFGHRVCAFALGPSLSIEFALLRLALSARFINWPLYAKVFFWMALSWLPTL